MLLGRTVCGTVQAWLNLLRDSERLHRMVDAGEVYAQIDEAASTVRFLQDPERYDSASVVQKLDSQIKRAMALGDRIRALNTKVSYLSVERYPTFLWEENEKQRVPCSTKHGPTRYCPGGLPQAAASSRHSPGAAQCHPQCHPLVLSLCTSGLSSGSSKYSLAACRSPATRRF